ncbi:uncharacterized protein RCC_03465 [Ramularia collo-cygni]|uniref:Aminoglycoside phosphotransferase domain-containing protein n=1 Tax=Ramularia collo-cygni TaxID=112498 RepID=A0A2D3USA0_9PEZI|nr:uncharacterized protein RCC_03465 [Ramularia collo-cygni]CZT17628.1 uncharacterized protein RCC_03465 [Ramularia collo-cygni]
MSEMWTPRCLRPDYTWPCPMREPIRTTTPPTPRIPGHFQRKLTGYVHNALIKLSGWYCAWFQLPYECNNAHLPFGLVMKQTERTSVEEVAAMMMARAAGMPVPKVLSCGEHYSSTNRPPIFSKSGEHIGYACKPIVSILMTRLPGIDLFDSADDLDVEVEGPWLTELKQCIAAMRKWTSPYGEGICSALGTQIHSTRVPFNSMGPFSDQRELYQYLFSPVSAEGFGSEDSEVEFDKVLAEATKLRELSHRVTFTHGDLKAHNILVTDDGHLSGILDWETGGWYPEYWEFTTAMRSSKDSWWSQTAAWMGGDQYSKELACDRALHRLTGGTYAW